jgi:hypothetical protein
MMDDRDFEIEAEKAILLLKENLNGLLDLAHLGGMRDEQLRIVKLIENMPWQTYYAVANDGNILDTVSMPKVLERDKVLALIKGEQK